MRGEIDSQAWEGFVVRGSWFVVRGSWFVVRGSWFVVRGSWFAVRGWPGGREVPETGA